MPGIDFGAISGRIRVLLGSPNASETDELAERLRLNPRSLRHALDARNPRPTLAVILALIRDYGVDPSWLREGSVAAEITRPPGEDLFR